MVKEPGINCPTTEFCCQKYYEDIAHRIYSSAHWESKDIHMLQGLNASVQGCMNKMWIILLIVKEMVIGGIHTFLKSCAENTISVFSFLSFSAWDIAHEGEKVELFSQKKTCTPLKLKVYLKYKFIFKFKRIFFQIWEHNKRFIAYEKYARPWYLQCFLFS